MHRRAFLLGSAGLAALRADARPPAEIACDEDFWRPVQLAFPVDRSIVNLNNGGVSPSPQVVLDAVRRYQEFSNHSPTHTMWRVLEPQIETVRQRLAASFGCGAEEIAITRNASEALQIVQLGLNLKAGDEVLTTDQDYPRMINTWKQRERRDGIVVKYISFPTPPSSLDDLYARFEQAITPRTRVIHFCHITNLTGQIFPVKRLCRMARERGIEAIVDGAHAYHQFPFTHADLDCDYYGTSLHKWLTAPIGTGMMYVRRSKIANLWPMMAAPESMRGDIRKFEEIGTHPAALHNAISEALTFHEAIGVERKAERLRYLRNRWMDRLGEAPGAVLRTSRDPAMSCGIGTISIKGKPAPELHQALWSGHRIVTSPIPRQGIDGLRITPNVYTTLQEIDMFCEAMERLIRA
jgi:selenocysteine lyase/cysteine desulfurase